MIQLSEIQKRLLEEVADLHSVPTGAYNIRANGAAASRCRSQYNRFSNSSAGRMLGL